MLAPDFQAHDSQQNGDVWGARGLDAAAALASAARPDERIGVIERFDGGAATAGPAARRERGVWNRCIRPFAER